MNYPEPAPALAGGLRETPAPGPVPVRPSAAASAAPAPMLIEYLERSPIIVEGPQTLRVYRFSAESRVQSVDPRDARSLLETRFFRAL
jgi:hypothetical protein